jgi:hypothetical protein
MPEAVLRACPPRLTGTFGASGPDTFRRGASFVIKILQGVKPADMTSALGGAHGTSVAHVALFAAVGNPVEATPCGTSFTSPMGPSPSKMRMDTTYFR